MPSDGKSSRGLSARSANNEYNIKYPSLICKSTPKDNLIYKRVMFVITILSV